MYNDDLKDVPKEIVVKMLELQKDQSNDYYGVKAFEKNRYAQRDEGGFDWDAAPEGGDFWETVLEYERHEIFFEKYPKEETNDLGYDPFTFEKITDKKPHLNYQVDDYVIVTELDGLTNYTNWFEQGEVLKLGGKYWKGSLEGSFGAKNRRHPNGSGMNKVLLNGDYKLRHANKSEIHNSFWGDGESFPLQEGDTFKNSGGKTIRVKTTSPTRVWYIHENNSLYDEAKSVILERLHRGLYTDYKSVNNSVINNQLNNNKHEVHRKNSELGRARSEGSRATRETVKIASASRPVGSRITNIRQRNGARKSTVSGRKLFSN